MRKKKKRTCQKLTNWNLKFTYLAKNTLQAVKKKGACGVI